MSRLHLTLAALALCTALASVLDAQAVVAPDTALPTTGIGYSGVDQFWTIVDILRASRT
jgi:hypothetical protein